MPHSQSQPVSREALIRAIDSLVVGALAKVFSPRNNNLAKSYSEQIADILVPALDAQRVVTTPKTAAELLPCPFCGGEADHTALDKGPYKYVVRCLDCAARVQTVGDKDDAFRYWNTRAPAQCDVQGGEAKSEFRKLQDIIDNQADRILDLHEVLSAAYKLHEFIAGAYILSLADFRYLNNVSTQIKEALALSSAEGK